jgi:hypothetical protein
MELQVLAIFRPLKSLAFVSDFCMKTTDICHCCLRSIPRCCGDSDTPFKFKSFLNYFCLT